MDRSRTATPKDVAAALHLRPATVQLYARNGRIPFDLTPGGHRRYNLDEVREALAISEGSLMAGPRRSRGGYRWLADATELDAWADRRAAQEELPVVVRTLIAGSVPDLEKLEFRAGEGVGVRGWDGLVEAHIGNAWVPAGQSGWEMSAREDVDVKADSDYLDRTENSLGFVPGETVFIFVTPRRWSNRDSWATTRRAEGKWKDVRALDADSLEQWLDATPAAHARVTRMLGRDPKGAADLDSAWQSWAGRTSPPLPVQLITAGREQELSRVWQWIHDEPVALSVVADSQDEAFAFVAASLLQIPVGERSGIEGRTIVIRSPEAWDEVLARTRTPLILIPTFPEPVTSEAVDAGHHVALPLDRNAVPSGTPIVLSRLRQAPAVASLVDVGIEPKRARELAALARRNLLTLQRRIPANASVERPAWANPDRCADVFPAIFAGAWRDDSEADREVLSSLANRPYDEVAETMTYWLNQPDPPVRRVGNLWFVTAKDDAWLLTQQFVTSESLARLSENTITVVTAVDPSLDLAPGKRWSAGIYGKVRPWSSNLRTGLADTIALLGARDSMTPLAGTMTGRELADLAVYRILASANSDSTGRSWASLDDVLPLLAEAAPDNFLSAVDDGVNSGVLKAIFDPLAEAQPFESPRHTGLLWALEGLAWDPAHFGLAVVNLARLAERDPGGRYANRPVNSLREIFLPWIPHTRASGEDRLAVLDRLRHATPNVAWRLIVSLLPFSYDTSTGTYQPRWLEGEQDPVPKVTLGEWASHTMNMVEWLLTDAGTSGTRWADLVARLDRLPLEAHEAVVGALVQLDLTTLTGADREAIVSALRSLVHQHRRHPDARWAISEDQLDGLETQLLRFADADPVSASAWLFSQGASLPKPLRGDYQGDEVSLNGARRDALRIVLEISGPDGIWRLGAASEQPKLVGAALADVDTAVESLMIDSLDAVDDSQRQVARGYVIRRFDEVGWAWADRVLADATDWSHQRQLAFLQSVVPDERTFDRVSSLGADLAANYWRSVWPLLIAESARPRAIVELISHDRAAAAVGLIDSVIRAEAGGVPTTLALDLVIRALQKAPRDVDGADLAMFAYYVSNILDFLEAQPAVDRSSLAQLEFQYLPLFEHQERAPRVLHAELTSNPDFFVSVLGWVFRSDKSDEAVEVSSEAKVRAELGYRLLRSWHTPPAATAKGVDPPLAEWVTSARQLLTEKGLVKVGDMNIGHVLRYVPVDSDGVWPTIPVRELIESVASQDLEDGIVSEVYNSRGVTFRDLTAGGAQERALAKQYQDYARATGSRWPRTRRTLDRIAEEYERVARREDQLAEIREDFWT
jgi:hypothetical protein